MRRLILVLAWCASAARAQDPPRGSTTAADHTFARAGFPSLVAPWARPGLTPKYAPGYIGGSAPLGSAGPVAPVDGIFGYDYVGSGPPGRVFLGWTHHPSAPRPGSYQTDGPRVFDIFSVRPLRRALSPGETGE